jgi:hypothetical protein
MPEYLLKHAVKAGSMKKELNKWWVGFYLTEKPVNGLFWGKDC